MMYWGIGGVLVSLNLPGLCDRGTYCFRYGSDFFGASIFAPRPKETLQAVSLPAWHDVNMKMRHALADAVVGGDERALRLHSQFDSGSKHFYIREKGRDKKLRQLLDRFKVTPGDKQAVAGKQGAMVEEGDSVFIRENTGPVIIAHDFAEGAVFVEFGGISAHVHW